MKCCYNTNFTLPRQSQRPRSILQDGSRILGLFWKEKIPSYNQRNTVLKERRLCWYGHVERSNRAVKTAFDIQVNGKCGPGRPKMTWKQLTERDRREWKLSAIDPHDRDTWRSGVRSAMRAASQLPGRGPTVVDMAPVPACLSKI